MSEVARIKSLAPVIAVDSIEPCLAFWTERLGFELTAQVPGDGGLVFAMLVRDDVTVMYQTRASLVDDLKVLNERDLQGGAMLYLTVSDIDSIETAFEGVAPDVPRRTTFYGATEIGLREPGGNLVVFAQHDSPATEAPE